MVSGKHLLEGSEQSRVTNKHFLMHSKTNLNIPSYFIIHGYCVQLQPEFEHSEKQKHNNALG